MLGSILLWILELSYALISGAWLVTSLEGIAFFVLLSLLLFSGWGVVAAIVQGVYFVSMRCIYEGTVKRWGIARARVVTSVIVTATILPYILYFGHRLFSGKGISKFPYVYYLKAGSLIIGVLAVYTLSSVVITKARTWFSPARCSRRNFALLCSITGLLIFYALNTEFYVGQYGFIHQAISLCLFLLAEFIVINFLGEKLLAQSLKGRVAKVVLFILFLLPLEMALVSFTVGGSPGSQQLSYIYSQSHLGKQLVWIYGFAEEVEESDAGYYEEYISRRDNFVKFAPKIKRKGCNLIWIMVDALRADHLPMYGYGRNTSPHLKKLTNKSLLFLRHYTQGTGTPTSLPAQMTGCYYSTVFNMGGINKMETLAEIVGRNGYSTWALVQEWDLKPLKENWNLDKMAKEEEWQGAIFEKIQTSPLYQMYPAHEITEKAIEWIKGREKDKPFFLFLFYYEPHHPYEKHPDFDYGNSAEDMYDSEIAYTDKHINKVLEYLWSDGLHRNTVIVLTADHGDEFGQHGGWGHGPKLYDAIIHVPLIMYIPDVKPMVIDIPVQSIDICSSLVELLDLNTDSQFDGSSFLPYIAGFKPPYTPWVFSEAIERHSQRVCLIHYPWKLMYHISDAYFTLYNVSDDPEERVNRIGDNPKIADTLKNKLLSWLSYRDHRAREMADVEDPEIADIINRLNNYDAAALGKLGELKETSISTRDFKLLAKALRPYFSPCMAEFLLVVAQSNEKLRPAAMDALSFLASSANIFLGEPLSSSQYDNALGIMKLLSDETSSRFFLSLLTSRNKGVRQDSLDILRIAKAQSVKEDLFILYGESEPKLKKDILPILCRLGDPRVEDMLFKMIQGKHGEELIPMIQLVVNYKSERCRNFLLDLLKGNIWHWHEVPMSYHISIEVGKSRNTFMLPVLKAIFCRKEKRAEEISPMALSFSKKTAIMNFVNIKGKEDLSADDRRVIIEAYESDDRLKQYEDLKELYDLLKSKRDLSP